MRAINLSNALATRGHKVTIISSDFDHFSKQHRKRSQRTIYVNENIQIKLIPSRGYKRHVGIARIVDHAQLGQGIRKIVEDNGVPDVAFIGFPPIEPAWVLTKWLSRRGVPYLLDVKDAWPDIFALKFPKFMRTFGYLILLPYFLMAKTIFVKAKGIVTPSNSFGDWSLKKAKRTASKFDITAPLTSPEVNLSSFEIESAENFWDSLGINKENQRRIYFVGSLTESFDFEPLVILARESNVQVVIAGEGPKKKELLKLSKNISNLVIPGWINQAQLSVLAERSQFSVIPTINRLDFDMTINNKLIDSLRLSKPILSSNSKLVTDFLNSYNVGLGYDSRSLGKVITDALADSRYYDELVRNTKNLY